MSTLTAHPVHPHIQFIVERESGGQLPFLDVLLTTEEDGTTSIEVYWKATHTDQCLAFDSHHPAAYIQESSGQNL